MPFESTDGATERSPIFSAYSGSNKQAFRTTDIIAVLSAVLAAYYGAFKSTDFTPDWHAIDATYAGSLESNHTPNRGSFIAAFYSTNK